MAIPWIIATEITLININSRLSLEMELAPRFVPHTLSTVYSRFFLICVMFLYIIFLKFKVCVCISSVHKSFQTEVLYFIFFSALGLSGSVW